jgi:hypothetical protein
MAMAPVQARLRTGAGFRERRAMRKLLLINKRGRNFEGTIPQAEERSWNTLTKRLARKLPANRR